MSCQVIIPVLHIFDINKRTCSGKMKLKVDKKPKTGLSKVKKPDKVKQKKAPKPVEEDFSDEEAVKAPKMQKNKVTH